VRRLLAARIFVDQHEDRIFGGAQAKAFESREKRLEHAQLGAAQAISDEPERSLSDERTLGFALSGGGGFFGHERSPGAF
jgi:hypothetical protein